MASAIIQIHFSLVRLFLARLLLLRCSIVAPGFKRETFAPLRNSATSNPWKLELSLIASLIDDLDVPWPRDGRYRLDGSVVHLFFLLFKFYLNCNQVKSIRKLCSKLKSRKWWLSFERWFFKGSLSFLDKIRIEIFSESNKFLVQLVRVYPSLFRFLEWLSIVLDRD